MARRTGRAEGWPSGHVLRGMVKGTGLLGLVLGLACGGGEAEPSGLQGRPAPAVEAKAPADDAAEEARRAAELAHRVVFADRITFGYVLLLAGDAGPAPTRAELQAIVRKAYADKLADAEVELLIDLVGTPPRADLGAAGAAGAKDRVEAPADAEAAARVWGTGDLLGLEIDAVPIEAVEDKALQDPELTRALSPVERDSLPRRRRAFVVKALYRNQNGVRGLRLLQALVRVVADDMGALVHDPDTLETMGPAAFAARRLQTSLGNVADQVAVVPFPDPSSGADALRLTTRGMRRFGSVDLELGGLARDLPALQQATYFLHGLALVMVRLGEFDRSGFAVEAPDVIDLFYRDCAAAYGGQLALPRCDACPEQVALHLVERAVEPQDPPGHVVARVVAPRAVSEAPGYDLRAWVRKALDQVLGRPGA